MLIATWNVNSIRTRIKQVEAFLSEVNPDILCLQETKVEDSLFPKELLIEKGYQVITYGQKAYNGVAMISKVPFEDIKYGISEGIKLSKNANLIDNQKRILSALIDGIRVVNVYVPNGSSLESDKYEYKIKWLNYLKQYLISIGEAREPLCLLGDFNIALEEKDIHNPKRFNNGIMASMKERESLKQVLDNKLEDVFRLFEQNTGHWSWWDYRSGAWQQDKGWRIDHIYLSQELIQNAKNCKIHKSYRGNIQPSDHAPVAVDLNWPPSNQDEDLFFG